MLGMIEPRHLIIAPRALSHSWRQEGEPDHSRGQDGLSHLPNCAKPKLFMQNLMGSADHEPTSEMGAGCLQSAP